MDYVGSLLGGCETNNSTLCVLLITVYLFKWTILSMLPRLEDLLQWLLVLAGRLLGLLAALLGVMVSARALLVHALVDGVQVGQRLGPELYHPQLQPYV